MVADSPEDNRPPEDARTATALKATRNVVLRELPPDDMRRMTGVTERITLATKDHIWEPNQPIQQS